MENVQVDSEFHGFARNSMEGACSYGSQYDTAYKAQFSTTPPMASIEPPLHGLARTPLCTDLHGPAQIRRCTDLHGKRATGFLDAWSCTDSMQLTYHFHVHVTARKFPDIYTYINEESMNSLISERIN